VILPDFLQVVLLTSCYLDATLRIGGSEEKEELLSLLLNEMNVWRNLLLTLLKVRSSWTGTY